VLLCDAAKTENRPKERRTTCLKTAKIFHPLFHSQNRFRLSRKKTQKRVMGRRSRFNWEFRSLILRIMNMVIPMSRKANDEVIFVLMIFPRLKYMICMLRIIIIHARSFAYLRNPV